MLKSILYTALRNIRRNKSFSLINLLGLSVSLSLCMLIILIVKEQFTYDRFHKDAAQIFQVNATVAYKDGGSYDFASVPVPVADVLRNQYTVAVEVVSMFRFMTDDVKTKEATVVISGLFVDPAFLEVFNFPLKKGSSTTALSSAASVVLTHEAAIKLFGANDPLGQTVSIGKYGEFIVSGILDEMPGRTHFEFEALLSTAALASLERRGVVDAVSDNWDQIYSSYVYVKLPDGGRAKAEQALTEISSKYGKNLQTAEGHSGYDFFLLPLEEITPGQSLAGQMGPGMPMSVLIFLGTLAAVVLVMSLFNFTNLTIAKSLTRMREIGVRKIVGAKRSQVFIQFVGESVVFVLCAMVLSYGVLQVLKQGLAALWLSEKFPVALEEDFGVYMLFAGFGIVVGLIAGLLPATYLSAFRPLNVIKDSGNVRVFSKLRFRQVLVVSQFTFSIVFLITVLVIYRQIDFMVNADYGFNKENVLNVHLQGIDIEKVSPETMMLNGVKGVGGVSYVPGTWNSQSGNYRRAGGETLSINYLQADYSYVSNLGLTFLAGENFNSEWTGERERDVILNEQALKIFGFADAEAAVGETILLNDTTELDIRGVVVDFHHRPLSDPIGPLLIRQGHSDLRIMSIWIEPAKRDLVLSSLSGIWKKIDSDHQLEYTVMEDDLSNAYRESGMNDLLVVAGYITVLAVTLACLGMLGMALYAVQTRVKEVGIRVVSGATPFDVVVLLSKSFMILVGIAAVVGVPISIIAGDQLLSTFAFHIVIGPWLILSGVGIIAGLALIMVGSQAVRSALENPVKALRTE